MTTLSTRLLPQQAQTLSPRLLQQVRLLQLSSQDFMQEIHAMLDTNPFLEATEGDPVPTDEADRAPDHEPWGLSRSGVSAASSDASEVDPLNLIPSQPTLVEHLALQLRVLRLDPRELALAEAIVESLDDDGWLRTPLDVIAPCAGLQPMAGWAEMRIALRRVQSLEPAGVGARSLQECLSLQARDIEDEEQRKLVRAIIDQHLDLLATSRDPAPLAHALGAPGAAVQRACERIRRMDPHPGWRHGGEQVQYITPDVLVRKQRGRWTTALNPAVLPRVCFNQAYADLFERHRQRHDSQLADHLRDARWAVRSVQQRFATILEVARSIVKRQAAFLEYGEIAIKPMALRDVAQEVGVHESTVSRVTNNKYMATSHGVFELKHFFSRAMTSASGSEYSGKAARELVSEMIRAEPPERPLTDAEIARQLQRQGLALCRRTVTNYRRELRIAPAALRCKAPAATADGG